MLEIGVYHTLTIDRDVEPGLFLTNKEGDEVLLPGKYLPEHFEIGDEIIVFVYLDNQGRPIATTLRSDIEVDHFAFLYCSQVTEHGAFLDTGIEKDLFVPFANQREPLQPKEWYVAYMYLDEKSNRLVGTTKVEKYLSNQNVTIEKYDKVDLIVYRFSELGANVIINEKYSGLIYKDGIFEDLRIGDNLPGYVKMVREDGKIDIVLQPEGYKSVEPNANYIYDELQGSDGFLPLHDKSSPDEIQELLGLSKKSFKKAIGALYKDRVIEITDTGIKLIKNK